MQGIENQVEEHCGEGKDYRLDIIIPSKNLIVEVKKYIDKDNVWKGVSQLKTYAEEKKIPHKVLIGLPPQESKREQAEKLINSFTKWDLKIHMLDLDKEDLDLDKIFNLNQKDRGDFINSIVRFLSEFFKTIDAYVEAAIDTNMKLNYQGA